MHDVSACLPGLPLFCLGQSPSSFLLQLQRPLPACAPPSWLSKLVQTLKRLVVCSCALAVAYLGMQAGDRSLHTNRALAASHCGHRGSASSFSHYTSQRSCCPFFHVVCCWYAVSCTLLLTLAVLYYHNSGSLLQALRGALHAAVVPVMLNSLPHLLFTSYCTYNSSYYRFTCLGLA